MPETVDAYLDDLRRRVPASDRWWDRALAEIDDHLRCAAEADGEAAALQRFGTPAEVAGGLAKEYNRVQAAGFRWILVGAAVAFVVLSGFSRNGPMMIGSVTSPALALVEVLLAQFGYAFGILALICAPGRPLGATRSALACVSCLAAAVLLKMALTPQFAGGLPAMAAVLALVTWALRRRAGRGEWLAAGTESAWLRVWRAHPALTCAVVCVVAGANAFQLGAMRDGLWPTLYTAWGPLPAGALAAAAEIVAVVAGAMVAPRLLDVA